MPWRIYRLPGSREIWHVDNGPETDVLNVHGFEIHTPSKSVDIPEAHPRAWIEILGDSDFYVIGGIAVWLPVAVAAVRADAVAEETAATEIVPIASAADH